MNEHIHSNIPQKIVRNGHILTKKSKSAAARRGISTKIPKAPRMRRGAADIFKYRKSAAPRAATPAARFRGAAANPGDYSKKKVSYESKRVENPNSIKESSVRNSLRD